MIPIYLNECHSWSDGEEHLDEDHNSAYDFKYFVLERDGATVYCCATAALFLFDLPQTDAHNDAIVDHCECADLKLYLQLNKSYVNKHTNARLRQAVEHFISG